jgi:predicted DNA-binding transcriptional regulator
LDRAKLHFARLSEQNIPLKVGFPNSSNPPQKDVNADLKGNTLRVYTYIFKMKQSGVREVQRALGLTSVSLAQYHLDKLVSMGLARKEEVTGAYVLVKEIKVETLEAFLKIGSHIFPRFLLYTVIVTTIFAYFLYDIHSTPLVVGDLWAAIIGVISLLAMWYETLRAWRRGP